MSNNFGMGVMLGILGGNEETVNSVKSSIGKQIKKVWLDEDANTLRFIFSDESTLQMYDDGQSCCEARYMRTDDNLSEYEGATIINFEIKTADNIADEYGDHEIQFLEVTTDKGVFQLSNHNEHNGYYGGFWIVAKP